MVHSRKQAAYRLPGSTSGPFGSKEIRAFVQRTSCPCGHWQHYTTLHYKE